MRVADIDVSDINRLLDASTFAKISDVSKHYGWAGRTRSGSPCRALAMKNGKCRMHGGASTGPRTAAGLARMREAKTIHGGRSEEMRAFRAQLRELRGEARKLVELT